MGLSHYKAGYCLENVLSLKRDENIGNQAFGLFSHLSSFDVYSNLDIGEYHSVIAVIHNVICKGLPTIPSYYVAQSLQRAFPNTIQYNIKRGSINFSIIDASARMDELINALHVVDPRLKLSRSNYNTKQLGSGFETVFLFDYLPDTWCFIAQVLEPQRPLVEIVDEDEASKFTMQCVDFSIECPYEEVEIVKEDSVKYRNGLLIEIDGASYHTLENRNLDNRRDQAVVQNKWSVCRVRSDEVSTGIDNLTTKFQSSNYFKKLQENHNRTWGEDWLKSLQIMLSPFAIARIQRVLCDVFTTELVKQETLRIAILEQDVPCGYLAVEDFKQMFINLCRLNSDDMPELPKIELEIFTTAEFIDSPLHKHQKPKRLVAQFEDSEYDLVIDISVLIRSKILKIDSNRPDHWVVIRSSHHVNRLYPRVFQTTELIQFKPLVHKDKGRFNDPIPEVKKPLQYFLQNIFRKEDFRVGQLPILHRALQHETVIGLLPTGGGKSLTYQLAAILQPGITVVIDPIKSLMQDQYDNLVKIGIDGCNFINSSLNTQQRGYAIDHFKKGEVMISFLSPERLQIIEFREALDAMYANAIYFSYCVIDEVHCLSEWGHDFRPAYLKLGDNIRRFGKTKTGHPITLFGLTATASYDVLADIERELSTTDNPLGNEAIVRYENTTRNELQYNIIPINVEYTQTTIGGLDKNFPNPILLNKKEKPSNVIADTKAKYLVDNINFIGNEIEDFSREESRREILVHAFEYLIPDEEKKKYGNDERAYIEENIKVLYFRPCLNFFKTNHSNAGILFCPHKKETAPLGVLRFFNRLKSDPNTKDIQSGWFMGSSGFPDTKIKGIEKEAMDHQQDFVNDKLDLIIATKAFGMGIDKPNIRFTYHATYPASIESFVQEGGRAGRDRGLGIVNVLYNEDEFVIHRHSWNVLNSLDLSHNTKTVLNEIVWKYFKYEDYLQLINAITTDIEEQQIIREKVFQIESVDKDVSLFFLGNSFRGVKKELTMQGELLNRVFFPLKNTGLSAIEDHFKAKLNIGDFRLNPWRGDQGKYRIYCNTEWGDAGSLDVNNNLNPWVSWDKFQTRDVNPRILLNDVREAIFEAAAGIPITTWLNQKPIIRGEEGILHILNEMEIEDKATMIIPFENALNNTKFRKNRLIRFLNSIGHTANESWINSTKYPDPFKYLNTYEFFIQKLTDKTTLTQNDIDGLTVEDQTKLNNLYYMPRDDADTAKAIYRLFCLGVLDDYTINYNANEYTIYFSKHPLGYYKNTLHNYLMRYYSEKKVDSIIVNVNIASLEQELNTCLEQLIQFVYDQIKKKRKIAIDDMQALCKEGVKYGDKHRANKEIKEFIYTYFNSKYARVKPPHEVNGVAYSLVEDTNEARDSNWDIVFRYMEVVGVDDSGSFDDNVKHLRGAARRLLRTNPDNAALLMLKAFTLLMLSAKYNNEAYRVEAADDMWNALNLFTRIEKTFDIDATIEQLNGFQQIIKAYVDSEDLFENIELLIGGLVIHLQNEWIATKFKPKFLEYDTRNTSVSRAVTV